ncbi:MAG TPA: AAA family ATPase [Dehalococcoidia bacterium]|nr:AAA family ATPase [Dehalococcoidia bacterium]
MQFVQTHISYVFLAGEFVYKLKKPVDFGFLDYTTPELRRQACEDEVRLNRRLSPDIYLGVLPVTDEAGRLRIGGAGAPCDWAVQMRRLPAERMLETLISTGAVPAGAAERLGEVIGRFHLSADRSERITAIGGRAAVAGNWRENFEQARRFRGSTIAAADDDRIQSYVNAFLRQESDLLAERDSDGHIRDLHGDLRCAQIWVLDSAPKLPADLGVSERGLLDTMGTIRILDCIEFSERLRFCDTASDLAFLATDLVYRRRGDLARDLLGRYLEVTGDSRLPLLLRFYSCYRAYVRGKVDSLGLTEREIDGRQRHRLAARARGFFRLAARYAAEPAGARLIAMMGVSGSGKSYLARLLALRLGAVLLSSDLTRKRIVGVPAHHAAGPAAYTHQVSARTYAALYEEAEVELRRGHSVILDATFLTEELRRAAIKLAERLEVPFTLVWCQAPDALRERRLRERQSDTYRVSDADLSIASGQVRQQEPPREVPRSSVIQTSTSGDIDDLLRRIERRLSPTAPRH